VLLAQDVSTFRVDLRTVCRPDGRVAIRIPAGGVRRAEPGTRGPLRFEARPSPAGTTVEVWGPPSTSADEVDWALEAARGWVGLADTPEDLGEMVEDSTVLRKAVAATGEVRLSRMPRVSEALGRAVLEQLVQGVESRRTMRQVAALVGTAVDGMHTWPTAAQLGRVDAWTLRRCGVSLRNAQALHAAAVDDSRLQQAARVALSSGRFGDLDRRLRALPGVGAWTSAETRLRLGDADAVSVGDYHLPTIVGGALGGPVGDGPDGAWTDDGMLQLLAPFAGQRGRVITLLERAVMARPERRTSRRAPRPALSAHRYW
jgi:3-methyladenine DNA glycosylase/8-oxoguanine DNA glycosylase